MQKIGFFDKNCLKLYIKNYTQIYTNSLNNADLASSHGENIDENDKQLHIPVMLNEVIKYLVDDIDTNDQSLSQKKAKLIFKCFFVFN